MTTKLTADFLRNLADDYAKHAASGRPAVEIATERGAHVGTVHRWVMEARRRGFLAPTTQGRISGEPESARKRKFRAAVYREAASFLEADDACQRPAHRDYYVTLLRQRADELAAAT